MDNSDSKSLDLLTKMLNSLPKSKPDPHLNTSKKKKTSPKKEFTPIAKRLRKKHAEPQTHKLDEWLIKKGLIQEPKKNKKYKELKNKTGKVKHTSKENAPEMIKKNSDSSIKQSNIDNIVNKKLGTKKQKISRSESSDSCDLPSFKISTKSKKKESKLFKKYGVSLPSVEEILKEQKDLEEYRNQVESFQPFGDSSFELPFSTKTLTKLPEIKNVLDCKHLSLKKISRAFKRNLDYISGIVNGKISSERHERFHDINNKPFTLTTKDLTYNTSMIVFNFDQKELMLTLLKEHYDPDDNLTQYFFQVLLPELCLKIFMDTHKMTYDDAVLYLDKRPVVED